MTAEGENIHMPGGAEVPASPVIPSTPAEATAGPHPEAPVTMHEIALGEVSVAAETNQGGWLSVYATASRLGYRHHAVVKAREIVRQAHPEWFRASDEDKPELERISPEGVDEIARVLAETHAPPPRGWVSRTHIEQIIGMSKNYVYNHLKPIYQQRPDWCTITTQGKKETAYFHPDIIATLLLKEESTVPSGWLTPQTIAVANGLKPEDVTRTAAPVLAQQPGSQIEVDGHIFVSPEVVDTVMQTLVDSPPGWLNDDALIAKTGWNRLYVNRCLDKLSEVNPELIATRIVRGKSVRYVDPDSFDSLKAVAAEIPKRKKSGPRSVRQPQPELGEGERRWVNAVIPAGWAGISTIARAAGRATPSVKEIVEALCAEHPEWVIDAGGSQGRFYSPELIDAIKAVDDRKQKMPDDWKTRTFLTKSDKVSETRINKILEPMREEHPEWFGNFTNARGHEVSALSPEAIAYFRKEMAERYPLAPKGWTYNMELQHALEAEGINISRNALARRIEEYRESNPEWFRDYRIAATGRTTEHIGPELSVLITAELKGLVAPEENWTPTMELAAELGITYRTLRNYAESYRAEHPQWFGFYMKDGTAGAAVEQYHPDLVRALKGEYGEREPAPEGWRTLTSYKGKLGIDARKTKALAESFREEYPEWFCYYRDTGGKWTEHISPELGNELIALTAENLEARLTRMAARAEREELEKGIQALADELKAGDSLQAKEFQSLLALFGAEQGIDIIYKQHPKYSKLPVPYVRGILADYLGGFMTRRPEFSLEGLKRAAPLLTHEVFREALKKVIKDDCLQRLKSYEDEEVNERSLGAIMDHLAKVRRSISDSGHRNAVYAVIGEVESYYRLLFTQTHKPDCFVDEINEDRTFPDINQRVNVLELALHKKILIGDDMGAGKSASAIMAKEILGAKQALVVVPSNVLEVWADYLTDAVDKNGRQLGYFKPGQVPRVFIVDDIYQLRTARPDDYDYVLVSQERLTEERTDALNRFSFDMLIVDEVHKLKNISSGKRAENLIALARHISGPDKYLALLSGTPVPNKVQDIAITLKLLYPEQFGSMPNTSLVGQILQGDILDLRALLLPRLQMKPLSKKANMPELREITHTIRLTPQEESFYNVLVEEEGLNGAEKLATLRRFAINPQLLNPTPSFTGSKLKAVNTVLQEEFASRDKLVLFVNRYVQGTIRGQGIAESLDLPDDVRILAIDGDVDKATRLNIQRQLAHSQGKILLMVSGQTADVGVDFSAAQGVLSYNDPWSVYDRRQQIMRVYRPGVADDITAHHFVVEGTIEQGIHRYIQTKYEAVEKLLRGIPISEIEKSLLTHSEDTVAAEAATHDLSDYYFSSWDKMRRLYGSVKEVGERDFRRFLADHDKEYARTYGELSSSRSYHANVARVAATVLSRIVSERGQQPEQVRVLDLASGPQVLRRYAPTPLSDSVVSIDINRHHFDKTAVAAAGSFVHLPVADKSVDYVNLSLGLHYTKFTPSTRRYERLRVMQEVNRVLPVGGIASFAMVHSLNLPTTAPFHATMSALGFTVIKEYTGLVTGNRNLRTQVITLEKTADCERDLGKLATQIGRDNMQGLKFAKVDTPVYNTRKVIRNFRLGGRLIAVDFNNQDQAILAEEEAVTAELEALRRQYSSIRAIPDKEIITQGMARIFNGRHYVLFKRLQTDSGAVAIS